MGVGMNKQAIDKANAFEKTMPETAIVAMALTYRSLKDIGVLDEIVRAIAVIINNEAAKGLEKEKLIEMVHKSIDETIDYFTNSIKPKH